MEALGPIEGRRVIDIGCGCGQTSAALARRVGPQGQVLGIDISAPMLRVAADRAARAGLANLRFLESDAQTHGFEAGAWDAVFSRFGVMFFSDPVAAFANIRTALAPGGRLAFVCWRAMGENPMMTAPLEAVIPLLPEPPAPPADPFAPGPFAFADRERLAGILSRAGFGEITIRPHDQPITQGTVEEALETSMRIGPLGAIVRDHPDLRARVTDALRGALARHATDAGVFFDSATWIVTARKEPTT